MNYLSLTAFATITIISSSCCQLFNICPDNCKPIVRYSGQSLLIEGIETEVAGSPVSVAKIDTKRQQIQAASQQVQIIDNHRVAMCKLIETLKDDPNRDNVSYNRRVEQYANDLTAISQFAIAAQNGDAALKHWIERYSPRSEAIVQEVAKVTTPETAVPSPETIADAALKNPEVGTLARAGNRDYKASTVPDEANLLKLEVPN
jgi:hypothetical protein